MINKTDSRMLSPLTGVQFATSANVANRDSSLAATTNHLHTVPLFSAPMSITSTPYIWVGGLNTTLYNKFIFELENITGDTANTSLSINLSSDNGATWDSTANYAYTMYYRNTSGGSATKYAAGTTALYLMTNDNNNGIPANSTTRGLNCTLTVGNMGSNSSKYFISDILHYSAASMHSSASCWGHATIYTPCNAIKFSISSGNITGGTVMVYGVPNYI